MQSAYLTLKAREINENYTLKRLSKQDFNDDFIGDSRRMAERNDGI